MTPEEFVRRGQAAQHAVDDLTISREMQETAARHAELLARCRDLSAEEILADIVILAQLAAFKVRHERAIEIGRAGVRQGGTHECVDWLDGSRSCQLCGKDLR